MWVALPPGMMNAKDGAMNTRKRDDRVSVAEVAEVAMEALARARAQRVELWMGGSHRA